MGMSSASKPCNENACMNGRGALQYIDRKGMRRWLERFLHSLRCQRCFRRRRCMDKQGFSVSEVNQYLKQLLESQSDLHHIPVMGEVSNFKRYASGHCYFTLKDEKSALKCVMFKSSAVRLSFTPRNGEKVVALGSISVYERDGVYQLYVSAMRRQGIGDLMQAYEALKEKLTKEGLFDDSRKKPLPRLPRAIGIITSPSGAAVHDIITVSRRRNKGVKLILYPASVQGEEAAGEIVHAIDFFQRKRFGRSYRGSEAVQRIGS